MTRKELNTHIEKRYSECCKRSQGLSYGSFYDGYVDCYCEQQKRIEKLEQQIEKMKWHDLRTDPNDLPKDRHNVWIVYLNGYYQEERSVASYRHKFWVIGGLKTECEVIAWCELPKWEIKEND